MACKVYAIEPAVHVPVGVTVLPGVQLRKFRIDVENFGDRFCRHFLGMISLACD
jgi:hypothetical protein